MNMFYKGTQEVSDSTKRLLGVRYIRIYQCTRFLELKAVHDKINADYPDIEWKNDPFREATLLNRPVCLCVIETDWDFFTGGNKTFLHADYARISDIPRKELRRAENAASFATTPSRIKNMKW